MKIDKSRFLLLTGAIAAATLGGAGVAGCLAADDPAVLPTTDTDGGDPKADGDSGDTTPETDSGADDDAAPPGDTTPETDSGAGEGGAGPIEDPLDAGTDASDTGAVDAGPPCLDDTGPAPVCEGGGPLKGDCLSACVALVKHGSAFIKSAVGVAVVECLEALPSCYDEGQLTAAALACQRSALQKACVSPAEVTACAGAVSACGTAKLTQAQCEQAVGGFRSSTFIGCVTEGVSGDCIAQPKSCLPESLR